MNQGERNQVNAFTKTTLNRAQVQTSDLRATLQHLAHHGKTNNDLALVLSAQRALDHLDHLACELDAHAYLNEGNLVS